jgi:imidazolonepropionase
MSVTLWDTLWINARLATMADAVGYGLIELGAIAVSAGKIAWIGAYADLPGKPEQLAHKVHDAAGRCITPGLIDSHTHVVYAGNRAHEFERRLQGETYASLAAQGLGIQSTVAATRAASEEDLYQQSLKRVQAMVAGGVTTLEIKSGYGLDLETELKILRVARRIGSALSLTVVTSFLGAHTLPLEYKNKPDAYIDKVCLEMLPAIASAGLADAVDVFCETIAFDLTQTERVFKAARDLGLPIKCHAEQLTHTGSALLAAQYGALSVDHLEYLSESGVVALAKSGTVAVLLPGAYYFLRETQLPPINLLRKHGVPIAIATDCNPGTSPTTSLLLMLNMASTLFGLTPEEALAGVTRNAARALGLQKTHGTLEVGKHADFVLWDVPHPVDLVYGFGTNPFVLRS